MPPSGLASGVHAANERQPDRNKATAWFAAFKLDFDMLRASVARTIDSPQTGRQAGPRVVSPAQPVTTSKPAGSERRSRDVTAGETALTGPQRGSSVLYRDVRAT